MEPTSNQTAQPVTTTTVATNGLITTTSGVRHADLPTGAPPALVSAPTWSGNAAHGTITLNFNMAMAAGSGVIYVTDGAPQTVIDRATGLPVTRIVGASDTHAISLDNVHIDGTHVTIDAAGLKAGHNYSVVMDAGVLVSSSHRVFGGLHGASDFLFAPSSSDTQPPALASIALDGATLAAGHPVNVTFTFSEAVTLGAGAIGAPNATVSNLHAQDDGHTWVATLTGAANTTSTSNLVSVDMGMVRDAAGNAGSGIASASASYTVDTVAPTAATITLGGSALTSGHGIGFTVTFAEAVTLDASAFTTPHASVSGLATSDGGRTWTGTLTTTETGASSGNTVGLDMSRVLDLAGNHGAGSITSTASYTVNADTTAPTVAAFTVMPVINATGNGIFSITFSEAVASLDASAISAPHASISGLHTVDNITWTGTLAGAADNPGSSDVITVDLTKVHDLAGNAGSGSATSNSYTVDTRAPTATLALDGTALGSGHPIVVTLNFSEAVGLTLQAIAAQHATVTNLVPVDDGHTWRATLLPSGIGSFAGNTLSVDMTKVFDMAGNLGSGTLTSSSYTVDSTATIVLDRTTLKAGTDIGVTITFAAKVSELPLDALSAAHAVVKDLVKLDDGLTWHLVLSASDSTVSEGNVLTIDLGKVRDANGNPGSGSVISPQYAVDTAVAAYISEMYINDSGISETDGVTNEDHQAVFGYIVGTIGEHQHLELVINGATIDPTHIETSPEGGLLFWAYYTSSETAKFNEGSNTISARLVDGVTGDASAAISKTFTVDTSAPSVATSPGGTETFALASPIVITFDEAVYWAPGEAIVPLVELHDIHGQTIGIDAADVSFSADHKTLTIDASKHHLVSGNEYSLYLNDVTDLAGNWLNEYSIHFKTAGVYVDTTPPQALKTLVSYGGSFRAGDTLQFHVRFNETVHLVGGATPTLELSNGAHAAYQDMGGDSNELVFSYTVAPGQDTYDLRVKDASSLVNHVADAANNLLGAVHIEYDPLYATSGYGGDIQTSVEIDTVAPVALSALHLADDDYSDSGSSHTDNITATITPNLAGSGAEHGISIVLYEGATEIGYGYSDDAGGWTATVYNELAEGVHNITARQVDFAGNESPASAPLAITIDTHAETLANPVLSLASDSGASHTDGITNVKRPTLVGSGAEPNAVITVWGGDLLDVEVGTTVANSSGVWQYTFTRDVVDGETYGFDQTDLAGNFSHDLARFNVHLDVTTPAAPAAPKLTVETDSGASATDGITNVNKPIFAGTGTEAGATITLFNGATAVGSTTSDVHGNWTYALTSALADGTYNFTIKQTDIAGNVSAASTSTTITIDTSAPLVADTYPNGLGKSFAIQFNERVVFAADGQFTATHFVDDFPLGPYVSGGTNWSIVNGPDGIQDTLNLVMGMTGMIHVTAKAGSILDLAGNAAIIGTPDWTFTIPILAA